MAKEPREQQETDADRIPDSGTGELDTDRLKQRVPLEADAGDDDAHLDAGAVDEGVVAAGGGACARLARPPTVPAHRPPDAVRDPIAPGLLLLSGPDRRS